MGVAEFENWEYWALSCKPVNDMMYLSSYRWGIVAWAAKIVSPNSSAIEDLLVYSCGNSTTSNLLSDGVLKAWPSLCGRKIIELHNRKNECSLTDLILSTVKLAWCPLVCFQLCRWLRDGYGIPQTIVLHVNYYSCSRGWERAMHKIDFNVVWNIYWRKFRYHCCITKSQRTIQVKTRWIKTRVSLSHLYSDLTLYWSRDHQ